MGKIVTSYGISKMTGKVGDAVFSIEQGGTGMRSYNAISKQPFTEAQLTREAAFTKANQTWPTIGRPAADAWRAWGRKQKVRTISGEYRNREGKDCFTGLFAKMLQINPHAAVPIPPKLNLVPDGVRIQIEVAGGSVNWTASGPNGDGLTTELMVQEIPSEVALPAKDGYTTLAFHVFQSGSLTYSYPLEVGYYAFACQTVEIATGRTVGYTELGFGTISLSMVDGGADDASDGLKRAA